ncbi:hypothetical protein Bhyg_08450 [Pseudolycoriella hygida]|uniref:Uncharacterized protein n=1 Tax=Pseudolycoriella hygida TaxID=35572 RepID=A0A9Q0N4M6_9DIPT|nr:hypothetical protein Bhyg_08450 [Pseudolycoriella hygida]
MEVNAATSWTQWSQMLKKEAVEAIGYQGPNDHKTWFRITTLISTNQQLVT